MKKERKKDEKKNILKKEGFNGWNLKFVSWNGFDSRVSANKETSRVFQKVALKKKTSNINVKENFQKTTNYFNSATIVWKTFFQISWEMSFFP